jgi:hypothetical protein
LDVATEIEFADLTTDKAGMFFLLELQPGGRLHLF